MLKVIKFLQYIIRISLICITTVDATNPVCTTSDCQKLGYQYQKHLSSSANPCSDFYDYVCHGWADQHPQPYFIEDWKVSSELKLKAMEVLKLLLENKIVSNERKFEQAKKLYAACLKLPFLTKLKPNAVKVIMTKVGNWPMFMPAYKDSNVESLWSIDSQYLQKTGESALFDFALVADIQMDNNIITKLKVLDSPYGMLKRSSAWDLFSSEKNYYKNFLKSIVEIVAPVNSASYKIVIDNDINDVIKFREKLKKITEETNVQDIKILTIKEFQRLYDARIVPQQNANVNWLNQIRDMYKNDIDTSDTARLQVQVAYFEKLARLLDNSPKRVILNHIHLYFAERHVILTQDMYLNLQKSISTEIESKDKIRLEEPRWMRCIKNHNMQLTINQMYVRAAFPETSKRKVGKLVEEIKDLLKQQIAESTWLDPITQSQSIDKVNDMTYCVGYPDWLDSTPKVESFDLDPLIPNAYYVNLKNRLYWSAAYLQLPIYSPNVPYVVLYGGAASLLAHEMYHAFDKEGINYDKNGKQPGWLPATIKTYKQQTQCFKKIYEPFQKEEHKNINLGLLSGYTIPDTLEEDIADAMGIKLAYKAYKNKLNAENGVCPVLPGFKDMGCEKLFFISYANEHCAPRTSIAKKWSLLTDEHSLPRVRVNAAVANMIEFREAFNCKPEDPLYLDKTCNIWQTY